MVGGQQQRPVASALSPALDAWLIRLQRSLALEAEHGFADLQGRQSRFSFFVKQCCAKGEPSLPATELAALQHFATTLGGYSSLNLEQRRRLVTQLRQHLHQLHRLQHRRLLRRQKPRHLRNQTVEQSLVERTTLLSLN